MTPHDLADHRDLADPIDRRLDAIARTADDLLVEVLRLYEETAGRLLTVDQATRLQVVLAPIGRGGSAILDRDVSRALAGWTVDSGAPDPRH